MWHTEFNLITAYLARLGKAVMFIEAEFRPEAESRPGSLGMTLCTSPEPGVAILQSAWRTGDFLLGSKDALEPGREEAVRRAAGTISAERYRLPGVDLELAPGRPAAPAGPNSPGKSAIVLALLRFTDSGLGPWRDQLGDGLDAVLAPWDHPVSGAEMQRLGQARAMLTGRPVLLLDEPTSHLDPATADATLMAMLERTGQRAVLWVTHRAAELAAFADVVDLAVRRHPGALAAG